MRRVFIIIASIIFILGILAAVWFFVLAPGSAELDVTEGVQFGSAGDVPLGNEDVIGADGPVPAGDQVAPSLIRITDSYVATGAAVISLPPRTVSTGTSTPSEELPGDTEIRYIDRASGNVYAYRFHERTLERISNRTLPGIQEATWLSDGSLAFVRFLQSDDTAGRVSTYALPSNGEGGYTLEPGLSQAVAIGTSTLFTLLPGSTGSVGTVANPDGTNPRTIFTIPLANVVAHPSNGPYMVHTKPSIGIDGYAFTVGSGGTLSRILGPFRGLSILPSPSGESVLFSYIQDRTLRLSVLNRTTGNITSLPLGTLAEKCVWAHNSSAIYCGIPRAYPGELPDDWHQGAVSFSDRLWRIDMQDRIATLLIDPTSAGNVTVDMVGLALDPLSDVLSFKNRIDGSLWAFDI